MATSQENVRVSFTTLSTEHFSAVKRALSNILSTNHALDTYAQVAEGIPIPEPADKGRPDMWWLEENRIQGPSQEAREIVETCRKNLSIESIDIDAKIAQRFQDTTPASRRFFLQLIEIVALLCHDFAASLFETVEGGLRKPKLKDPPWSVGLASSPYAPFVTLFYHPQYRDHDFYPRGAGDTVGYWVESRLFGGVVLFDRGTSGTECNDVFFNPMSTPKVFQLSEAQLQQLIEFLTLESNGTSSTDACVPFQADEQARLLHPMTTVDHNVYRNQYDRRACEYRRPRGEDYYPRGADYRWLQEQYLKLGEARKRQFGP